MGYESSKVYKLQHEDGHFYIGSSINELRMRLRHHKNNTKNRKSRVYTHINGEWDKVKIVLIEAFECNNRDELRRKEQEYIQKELKNELCLNHNRAFRTEEERKQEEAERLSKYNAEHKDDIKEHKAEYYEANKDKINERNTKWREANKDKIKQQHKEYYEANKDKISEYQAKYRAKKKAEKEA